MSSPALPQPPAPPDPASSPQGSTVRRHHTITATSRTARAQAKDIISEELPSEQAPWNDDEPVDHDWVGGVGAVGEKTSLHRQSSLPTRYHRGFQGSSSANLTPKAGINSLAAIAGHEGDEEPWNLAEYNVQVDEQVVEAQEQLDPQVTNSPLSSHLIQQPEQVPSPPPAGSGVRRHVSLTYGTTVGGARKLNTGLKRSGTLQATTVTNHSQSSNPSETSEYQEGSEYAYDQEDSGSNPGSTYTVEEEAYFLQQTQQQQYGGANHRSTAWGQNTDWRAAGNTNSPTIDDVQRALSTLEIASGGLGYNSGMGQYAGNQPSQPPRFSAPSRGSNSGNGGNAIGGNGNKGPADYDGGRRTPSRSQSSNSNWQQQQQQQRGDWDNGQQHQGSLGGRRSNSNLQYSYQQSGHSKTSSGSNGGGLIPAVPAIPHQYLQQSQQHGYGQHQQPGRPGLGLATNFAQGGNGNGGSVSSGQTPVQPFINTPIDVPSLIAVKGYNPATFDIKPGFARYFVIKSYTEDDVHKSLKYEIWSSTEPGNKRLDKAFKETGGRGPIYLFFSVNASGHFCGMAEMLTAVDYTRSSTVWASDKWKGVFKVRWIFVRDIPNSNLRHIKLNNTQERKPVTNSRDTQELLPDAGQEMLRIFYTHPARTSLLQDFAFYELQAMQKMQGAGGPTAAVSSHPSSGANSPPLQPSSVVHSPQMSHTSISSVSPSSSHANSNSFSSNAYQNNTYGMNPMMQMQMGMGIGGLGGMGVTAQSSGMGMGGMNMGTFGGGVGMGMGNLGMGLGGMGGNQFGVHSQTHQAVMRHASPTPSQGAQGHNQGQGQGPTYGY